MGDQAFTSPNQLLQHLLAVLEQQPDTAVKEISGKNINMAKVICEFYTEVSPPHGRAHFLQYCIVWLYNNWQVNKICSRPEKSEYETAWRVLRDYSRNSWEAKSKILRCLARFGEHLILRCIYPMMAQPRQTTPSTESSQHRRLRQDCLRRDGNRSVISGKFNQDELAIRWAEEYQDDDGNTLLQDDEEFEVLEVTHIIPGTLGWPNDSGQEPYMQHCMNVLVILDMFCPGTLERYHGASIDCPQNALTLEIGKYEIFGQLDIYFEPIQDSQINYTVHHVSEEIPGFFKFPKNITFRNVTDVPLPDSKLLAIHRACARIAHATGAAESYMRFFHDLEDATVETDGSTPLDHLVAYRLGFHQNPAPKPQE